MIVGGKYNWKGQSERLVYIGRNWSGNGYWHQFEKVDAPGVVWCEVLDADLSHFEEAKPEMTASASVRGLATEPISDTDLRRIICPITGSNRFTKTERLIAHAVILADRAHRTVIPDVAKMVEELRSALFHMTNDSCIDASKFKRALAAINDLEAAVTQSTLAPTEVMGEDATHEFGDPSRAMTDDELQDFCIAVSIDQDDYTVDVIRNVERRMLGQPLFESSVMSNAEMDGTTPTRSSANESEPEFTCATLAKAIGCKASSLMSAIEPHPTMNQRLSVDDVAKIMAHLHANMANRSPRAMKDGTRLWLWTNGDHLLAFENEYPCFEPGGDPMTLGNPTATAIFKTSFDRQV